jgi:hypothetical protein
VAVFGTGVGVIDAILPILELTVEVAVCPPGSVVASTTDEVGVNAGREVDVAVAVSTGASVGDVVRVGTRGSAVQVGAIDGVGELTSDVSVISTGF